MFRVAHEKSKDKKKEVNPWDDANMLQNVKNEGVHVTTVANQRYVYREFLGNRKVESADDYSRDDRPLSTQVTA